MYHLRLGVNMYRVLLVDDSAVFRHSLHALVKSTPNWEVCGEAENGENAARLAEELRPDAVLVDLSMPGIGGVKATQEVRYRVPGTKIIVLSLHQSKQIAETALEAGANGYVLKERADRDLIEALEAVLRNETYVSVMAEKRLAKPA